MAFKKWRRFADAEKPKDHAALPDTLDTGYHEERDVDGQLFVYLQEQPALYIVLGKYAQPQRNGNLYYVSDYTSQPTLLAAKYYKFDHLLLAIAQVHELIQAFEARQKERT